MARKNWLAKILLYAVLEMGALFGVPIRPDDIEELTRQLHGTTAVTEELQEQDEI